MSRPMNDMLLAMREDSLPDDEGAVGTGAIVAAARPSSVKSGSNSLTRGPRSAQVGEEQRDLAGRGLRRVRAVDDVLAHLAWPGRRGSCPGRPSTGLVAPIIVRQASIDARTLGDGGDAAGPR